MSNAHNHISIRLTGLLGAVAMALSLGTAQTASADPKAPASACPGGELDGCYTEAQMDTFLQVGQRMVGDYLTQIGVSAMPRMVYVAEGSATDSRCVGGTQDEQAYDYCPADNTVYIGQRQLWEFYRDFGAAGPVAGLAHEHGHYLQAITGVPDPQSDAETIRHEDQADCVAGAFVSHLQDLGDVEYPGDFRNLGDFLRAIGSAEGPGRDHGTPTERVHSFEMGFFSHLHACNSFYPDNPIAK